MITLSINEMIVFIFVFTIISSVLKIEKYHIIIRLLSEMVRREKILLVKRNGVKSYLILKYRIRLK